MKLLQISKFIGLVAISMLGLAGCGSLIPPLFMGTKEAWDGGSNVPVYPARKFLSLRNFGHPITRMRSVP